MSKRVYNARTYSYEYVDTRINTNRGWICWYIAGAVAIAIGIGFMFGAVSLSEGNWKSDIASAKHIASQAQTTGTIISTGDPNYSGTSSDRSWNQVQPFRSDMIQYLGKDKQTHTVKLDMPVDYKKGTTTLVYVASDESVYVPSAADWVNQVDGNEANPYNAPHGFWPAWSIALSSALVLVLCPFLWWLLFEILWRVDPSKVRNRVSGPTGGKA